MKSLSMFLISAATTILIGVLFAPVLADDPHHDHDGSTVVVENGETIVLADASGVATGIATGQCSFDWSPQLQGCVAYGTFGSSEAYVFGVGMRVNKLLLNGVISYEDGDFGAGAAANWRF